MKKSQIYTAAMLCVINNHSLSAVEKLEIIEQLIKDRQLAEMCEKNEEDKF